MGQRKNPIVTEFVQRLTDDQIYYLLDFVFKSKPAGYLPDLCDLLSRDEEIDRWLKTAVTVDEFFEKIDIIESAIYLETDVREQIRNAKKK